MMISLKVETDLGTVGINLKNLQLDKLYSEIKRFLMTQNYLNNFGTMSINVSTKYLSIKGDISDLNMEELMKKKNTTFKDKTIGKVDAISNLIEKIASKKGINLKINSIS